MKNKLEITRRSLLAGIPIVGAAMMLPKSAKYLKTAPGVVLSGISALDKITGGFRPGEVTLVGASRSSTTDFFSINILNNAAVNKNVSSVIFTKNDDSENHTRKLLSKAANLSSLELQSKKIPDGRWTKLIQSAERISIAPLYFKSHEDSWDKIKKISKSLKENNSLELIIVDAGSSLCLYKPKRSILKKWKIKNKLSTHFQQDQNSTKFENEEIQKLAKSLNVPIIVLRSVLADDFLLLHGVFKGSLKISRLAEAEHKFIDNVILLHKSEFDWELYNDPFGLRLSVEKSRLGKLGSIQASMQFHEENEPL